MEEEFHVVDLVTRERIPRAPELLDRLPEGPFTAELQMSVVETNSAVVTQLDDLRIDLRGQRSELTSVASGLGLGVVAAGTVPLFSASHLDLTDYDRYRQMHDDYQLLVREQLICGTQIHVDVPDRDLAVAVAHRLSPWLPLLLAMSASSPYWNGEDCGYASSRSLAWQRWPTAGGNDSATAAEHESLVADLVMSGTISDPGMIYFDVRPSAHLPTLELRVTDSCPEVDTIVLLAGLFRALVRREIEAALTGPRVALTPPPLQRAAMWRAARSGLEGDLVDLPHSPHPVLAATAVASLLEGLRDQLEAAGDWEQVSVLADRTLSYGSSAAKQRRVFDRRGRLADVVDHLLARTSGHLTVHSATAAPAPLLVGYRMPRDEAVGVGGTTGPDYVGVVNALERLGPRGMRARERTRDEEQRSLGVTFGVPGEASTRLFPVDLVPRVVSAPRWSVLRQGLVQRARTLDAFLHDVYSERAVVRDGIIPAWVVDAAPGLRPTGVVVRNQAVRAHVCGTDLVHDGQGGWFVLEDNLRVLSGIGYAIQNRRLCERVMPELPRPATVSSVEGVARALRETLEAAAPPATPDSGATVALLSSGASDSAWFEHRMLAKEMGVPVVHNTELLVVDGVLTRLRDGVGTRIDVLYLRTDEETLLHAVGGDGRPIGGSLIDAVDRGTLALANAPRNGVGDDKAVYAFVGAMTEYYLGERPLLNTVPTYLCGEPDRRDHVLANLAELVVKPVDGYGGEGVLIGPHANEEQLAATARQVRAAPHRWIAQDVVPLSTLPCFDGDVLVPRHVDLRAFVFSGEQVEVAPVALTRVAPEGSMIVNSSRGGGSKDTWLLADPAEL